MTAVAIAHTAARSAFGAGTRGLAQALATRAPLGGLPSDEPLAAPRARNARKMMSRAAYLAAHTVADLLRDAGWVDARDRIGYFLGVGASGGSLDEVTALLAHSIVDRAFSVARFGDRGLAACNPLLAFQLMNNFTMCHGAILEGLGGPNGVWFSRGAGTIGVLAEAVHAVRSGDCDRAIAGGADVATHPVTVAELTREGFIARGLVPAEGVGLVALVAASGDSGAVIVEGCAHASGRDRSINEAIDDALDRASRMTDVRISNVSTVVVAPWGPPAADVLRTFAAMRLQRANIIDTSPLGECLAASAALAVIAGADALAKTTGSLLVLTLGVDGDPGAVVLSRRDRASRGAA